MNALCLFRPPGRRNEGVPGANEAAAGRGWLVGVCSVCVCVCVPFSSVPTWLIHFLNMYYTFAKKTVVTRPGHARPLIFILGTRTRNALCLPARCIWQLAPTKTATNESKSKSTAFPTPRAAFAVTFESRA